MNSFENSLSKFSWVKFLQLVSTYYIALFLDCPFKVFFNISLSFLIYYSVSVILFLFPLKRLEIVFIIIKLL